MAPSSSSAIPFSGGEPVNDVWSTSESAPDESRDLNPVKPASPVDAALSYLGHGWSVIPVKDKRPLVRWEGFQKHRPTEAEVRGWWTQWPAAGVGIVTGAISRLLVLDVDGERGVRTLEDLLVHQTLNDDGVPEGDPLFPDTPVVQTAKGGHLYFALHPGSVVPSRVGVLPGLDVRAEGGYVVAPPSVHPSGVSYRWLADTSVTPVAPVPFWLLLLLTAPTKNHAAARTAGCPIPTGERNESLYVLGRSMRDKGATPEAIRAALGSMNVTACEPPLPGGELDNLMKHVIDQPNRIDYRPSRPLTPHVLALHVRDAADIAAKPTPVPPFWWDGWIRHQTMAILHGRGGDRKSWLALALGISEASGKPLFPGAPCGGSRVLYVSGPGENPDWLDDQRFLGLCEAHGIDPASIPFSFINADRTLLGVESDYRELLDIIIARRPGVVILDSGSALSNLENENGNADVRRFIGERVAPLSRQHRCTVLLLAHAAKPAVTGRKVYESEDPRGASAWRDAVDITIHVQDKGTESHATLRKYRVAKHQQRVLAFTVEDVGETGRRFSARPLTAPDSTVAVLLADAEAMVRGAGPDGITATALRKALEGSHRDAGRHAYNILRGKEPWPSGPAQGHLWEAVEPWKRKGRAQLLAWRGLEGFAPGQRQPAEDAL